MVSSPMAVSPRETRVVWHRWRGLVCASLLFVAGLYATSLGAAALAQEPRFFRIGTAATGGSFFEIGGLVAGAVSSPADGPLCGHGGSCGVRGLVAVAQATPGSIENLRLINTGQIESGFAQADLAGWAYNGVNVFAEAGALRRLRVIASLFPEAAHLVVRAESPISSLADLAGKSVSVGEAGSGSAADAAVLFAAAGLGDKKLTRKNLRPGPAAEELKAGTLDALFLVGGYPVPAIRDLAAAIPVRLVPIEGKIVDALKKDFSFYSRTEIPGGSYPGVDTATPSLGFSALWLVNADIDADLVYAITRSLWHPATAQVFAAADPIGKGIRRDRALDGLSVPLHPGAARFYRETGMPVDSAPEATAEPVEGKRP
jgi:TRAP transporter TAXI family solute receptor